MCVRCSGVSLCIGRPSAAVVGAWVVISMWHSERLASSVHEEDEREVEREQAESDESGLAGRPICIGLCIWESN